MRFPRAVLAYVITVFILGLAVAAFAFARFPLAAGPAMLLVLAALVVLAALGDRYGLHLTQGTRVHVDTIPIFAAILLFSPAQALLVAGLGRILGRIRRGTSLIENTFNLGQTLVCVGLSALVRQALSPTPWMPGGPASWLAVLAAGLLLSLLNTGIVSGIVCLQNHASLLRVWSSAVPLDLLEQSVMYGFGLLAALVVVPHPWALLLMALPSIAVFITLERSLRMEAKQKQLAEQNAELASHLRDQAEQLRQSYAVLEDALHAKNSMIQNVSHELRTPMVSILGFTQALQEALYGPMTDGQLEALATIERNTQHMVELVNDLLSLQALDRSQLVLGDVRLPELLLDAASLYAERAEAVRVRLHVDYPDELPPARADGPRLGQVVHNLLDNAIKFSPGGGEVWLQAQRHGASEVEIRVADQGIGIPKAELSRIYQSFYQVDSSTTRRFGGQGLGLAIARRIVELHGGSIRAESELGHGTTFFVVLPAATPAAGMPPVA